MIARSIHVRGVVQGVGFRPFVYRLAHANGLAGWALNQDGGVELHLEGAEASLQAFLKGLWSQAPPAAHIAGVRVAAAEPAGHQAFTIRSSERHGRPSAEVSPDLAVCPDCLRELFDPADRRYLYPYVNCTNCGPRYSVIERLPYDRSNTTLRSWQLDAECLAQYLDPADRRFHAEPIACPDCGPRYVLRVGQDLTSGDSVAVARAAHLLAKGGVVAVKGLGGYHLACDARNEVAVAALRERKFRKERPFAVMARDLDAAREIVDLRPRAEALLTSEARPIVLAPARLELPEVAPGNTELGLMLPYTPVHHMLFAAGAPAILVMTSANRSNEPIAYQDADALERLAGLADAFLIGERAIARRVDDSIVRPGPFGETILRRARGLAPGAVTNLPSAVPVLALGADLKNSITLVVEGRAFVSQHIGDLAHHDCRQAFRETMRDLTSMYDVDPARLIVAHDLHPQYASTIEALELDCAKRYAVQHHRAHVASVLAEREAWDTRVIGVSFDGTGYGDDGTIWGGEFFVGSLREGFERFAHLRPALLPGGDSAARFPVQAAAGFVSQIDGAPDLCAEPFSFPERYRLARRLSDSGLQSFQTTSVGRLFDAASAILGFDREATFEGQAAMWLEQTARRAGLWPRYSFPFDGQTLDYRPLLAALIEDRQAGRDAAEIARGFQRAFAAGVGQALQRLCEEHSTEVCVLSGGVFQNVMLLEDLQALIGTNLTLWTNTAVPPNDGGVSLGQAAMAVFDTPERRYA